MLRDLHEPHTRGQGDGDVLSELHCDASESKQEMLSTVGHNGCVITRWPKTLDPANQIEDAASKSHLRLACWRSS